MSFDWKNFTKIAKHLQQQGEQGINSEASYRCAVSRSYYSAFCHTRNYARDNLSFIPTYDTDDHHKLRDHFRQYYQRQQKFRNIHIDLQKLHQLRKRCDYDDEVSNLFDITKDAIRMTERILTKLDFSFIQMNLTWTVVIREEEGGFWVEVPALEGCLTQGESVEEAIINAREAIELYLEGLAELGEEIPTDETVIVNKVEVAVNQ